MVASDLESLVDRCLVEGTAAWPQIVSSEELRDRVRTSLAGNRDPIEDHLADLYLATAAGIGEPAAIGAVHALVARVAGEVARSIVGEGDLDELAQEVRVKLLVGDAEAEPRIRQYRAVGPLAGWVRAVVIRTALNARRRRGPAEVSIEGSAWLELPVVDEDPAVAAFRRRHMGAFRDAFESAVSSLSARERTMLRHHFLDGLTSEQLGRRYRVHRVTAYRWIAEVKRKVLERTRQELESRLGGTSSEIASVMRGLRSGFAITVERLLAVRPRVE